MSLVVERLVAFRNIVARFLHSRNSRYTPHRASHCCLGGQSNLSLDEKGVSFHTPDMLRPASKLILTVNLLCCSLLLSLGGGCRDSTCGPGTSEQNGVCVAGDGAYTCQDVCEKRLLVCGFNEFNGDVGTCVDTCLEEDAVERNLACYQDSTCVEIANGDCNGGGMAVTYQAYQFAGGPYCGSDSQGDTVECEEGHRCRSSATNICERPTDNLYEAFQFAGGPYCGEDALGDVVECQEEHTCSSSATNTCLIASDGTYEAYQFAGGPICGEDSLGDSVECEAGHTCTSVPNNSCSR